MGRHFATRMRHAPDDVAIPDTAVRARRLRDGAAGIGRPRADKTIYCGSWPVKGDPALPRRIRERQGPARPGTGHRSRLPAAPARAWRRRHSRGRGTAGKYTASPRQESVAAL